MQKIKIKIKKQDNEQKGSRETKNEKTEKIACGVSSCTCKSCILIVRVVIKGHAACSTD
jgi:hypothetical protein